MSRLTASRAAFDLIASFEGFRTRAVLAPDGQWTLGFGHTAAAREGLTVTRAQAEDLLRWDLLPIEDLVRQTAFSPLSQNQFDALVSFAFNIGIENFRNSEVLKCLNQGRPVAAALAMHAWRRALVNGRVVTIDALVRRRAAEAALFLQTIGARPAAPSSVIRPQIDYSVPLPGDLPFTPNITSTGNIEVQDATFADLTIDIVAPEEGKSTTATTETPPLPDTIPFPTAVIAEPVPQDVLVQQDIETTAVAEDQDTPPQGPVVLPPIKIAPISDAADTRALPADPLLSHTTTSPMLPDGLSPFPGSVVYTPANGIGNTISAPANDGLKTRLHTAPEVLDMPIQTAQDAVKTPGNHYGNFSILVWSLMALGAALLAFGLFFSWQSGILTVTTPRRDPTPTELAALLAAASGLIILVTSAVSALTGKPEDA